MRTGVMAKTVVVESETVEPRVKNNWTNRISKAEKFLDQTVQQGRRIYQRYQDERMGMDDLVKKVNFFYANTNVFKESLYNSLPKPSVSRMQKEDYNNDVARVASIIVQRGLTYEVNCCPWFDEALKAAILDRLVPGMGVLWFRFDSDRERICIDTVYWEDFIYGPARGWSKVPWVGRKRHLTRKEAVEQFGTDAVQGFDTSNRMGTGGITPEEIDKDKICVYEIWDKKTMSVYYVAKGAEYCLRVVPDPYELVGFFPCPKPLMANPTTVKFLPLPEYI